jgi:hypothetical protein
MPNIDAIIRDHVVLSTSCIDRLYVNGYMPKLQTSGQLCYFLREVLGNPIPSPALLGQRCERFRGAVRQFVTQHEIPEVRFQRGVRKDDVVAEYRARSQLPEGVVLLGVAQERCRSFKARKSCPAADVVDFQYSRQSVYVNHYYFYFQDRHWGPGFLKVGSYCPYPVKLCLNGHEWVKQQLRREGIGFESLDNGFLACDDPQRLQHICNRLGPADVQRCFDRWSQTVPWPLSAQERVCGYDHRLTIWQMEVALTQVFDRPLWGRQFFEQVIREHLDLGRPDRVSVLFPQRLTKRTPPPTYGYRTRVFTQGVEPSLHLDFKRSHVKQYFKGQRALRTETTINDPRDLFTTKGLHNLPFLRSQAETINRKLLQTERLSHDCWFSNSAFERLQRPTVEAGLRSPALRFTDPRVRALLDALCAFVHLPAGFRHRDLRPRVAALLGNPHYRANQMTYDLRRLRRKGIIARIKGTHRYVLTTYGVKVAVFCAKLYHRVFRPAWQAIDATLESTPLPIRRLFDRLLRELDHLVNSAQLKNLTHSSRTGGI